MAVHVAILMRPYLELVLTGRKTVESRLTITAREPYRRIMAGERIFFKASAGPFMAAATAGEVEFFENLTPGRIDALRRRFNATVCGDTAYWKMKRNAKFGVFIHLRDVQPTDTGPAFAPSPYRAWFVLPDGEAPVAFDVRLTDGAIRNGYLRVPDRLHVFPLEVYGGRTQAKRGQLLELLLPEGRTVSTDVACNRMLRWRGWGRLYETNALKPGDVVRFEQLSARQYRVRFVPSNGRGKR